MKYISKSVLVVAAVFFTAGCVAMPTPTIDEVRAELQKTLDDLKSVCMTEEPLSPAERAWYLKQRGALEDEMRSLTTTTKEIGNEIQN